MFRFGMAAVAGTAAFAVLFELAQYPRTQETGNPGLQLMHALLESQPRGQRWLWRLGPLPPPGGQGKYIILFPREVDWECGGDVEGRELPPLPILPVPRRAGGAPGAHVTLLSQGNVQTEWVLIRKKSASDHELHEASVEGRIVTGKIARLACASGLEPELFLYECYSVPLQVCIRHQEISVPFSSRYPLGKRLIPVGLPWVNWGEPSRLSATTCRAAFVPNSLDVMDKVPKGEYELQVVMPVGPARAPRAGR